jgi:nitrate reductase alpha subunit
VTKGVAVNTAPEYEAAQAPTASSPTARRRPAGAGHRGTGLRGDPHAVRHHQRPGGGGGFRNVEERTGQQLADLALDNEGKRITFADTQARPVPVITSPEWSGSEHGGRRYTAFTINVERLKPWHTLTGRQHFFLDHDWMTEIGEQLPTFRPPLNMHRLYGDQGTGVVRRSPSAT